MNTAAQEIRRIARLPVQCDNRILERALKAPPLFDYRHFVGGDDPKAKDFKYQQIDYKNCPQYLRNNYEFHYNTLPSL